MFSKYLLSERIRRGWNTSQDTPQMEHSVALEWDGRQSKGYPLTEAAPSHRPGLSLPPRPDLRSSVLVFLLCLLCSTPVSPGPRYLWFLHLYLQPPHVAALLILPCSFCQVSAQKSSAQKEPPWPLSKFLTLSLPLKRRTPLYSSSLLSLLFSR